MLRYLGLILLLKILFLNPSFSQIINDLQINGNKRLSSETIKVIGDIELEKNYDEKKLNELIKKFYKSGFFKNVSVNIEKNTLIVDLTENPIVEDIQIEGIKRQSVSDLLLEEISLKNRKPFNEYFLGNDINLIQNILKTSGYYFAEISSSIEENNDLNSVRVKINIDQGPRAKIKKISFIGDKKIKDKKLLEIIASEEHKFWKFISNKVYLDQSRIDLDKRLIENYYRNLGYYFVKVLSSFAEFNRDGNFNLTYNIDAGDLYYFNNLELNLPSDYNVKDFDDVQKRLIKLKDEKFSIDDFNKILTDIEKIASSRLYDFIDAQVEEQIIDNNKIDFKFNVVDSTSYYVEEINILGNYNTIEEVIRNRLIVDEGDPLNNILYNKSLDNLKSLRIFKKVEGKIKDGSDQKLKKIDIVVEEMPTGEISLAAGVGTSGSTIGGGIKEKNFLGKGINLSTNIEISENSIRGQFIYSKPNFAYTDNTLHTSLTNTSTNNLSDFGYKVSELGFSLGTEFEQFQNFFYSPSISASLEDLETNSNASTKLRSQAGDYTDIYFKYGLNYDLRNSSFRPSAGNRTNFYQELPLFSDGNEVVNSFKFDQFKKISKNSEMIGKASFLFKAVNSIGSNDVRVSKRANVPYSRLRGFEKGKIGPIDNADYIGGNYVASMNLSANLPFILPTLEAIDFSYFIDAANVWGVDYNKDLDNSDTIRTSTGIGMNVLTPVGPLSFSLSQPITKESSDKTESFRFNLGTTF